MKSYIKSVKPLNITWKPKDDITAYEIALCLPLIITMTRTAIMPGMIKDESFMRHFEVINPNI